MYLFRGEEERRQRPFEQIYNEMQQTVINAMQQAGRRCGLQLEVVNEELEKGLE